MCLALQVFMELARVMINSSTFMAAQPTQDGVDVQGTFDNDTVGSSTGDLWDHRKVWSLYVRAKVYHWQLTLPDQISLLATIGGGSDSLSHWLGCFVSEMDYNDLSFLEQTFLAVQFTEPSLCASASKHEADRWHTVWRLDRIRWHELHYSCCQS